MTPRRKKRSTLSLVFGSVLLVWVHPTAAGIVVGGDVSWLAVCDLEEFAASAVGIGGAFVTLGNESLGIFFGEKLVGQVNTPVGRNDVITGTPTTPLTMDTSIEANVGVNVLTFGTTVIDGLGPLAFPLPEAIGDGALTVLYAADQRVIAFDVVASNGGTLEVQVFDRTGASLAVLTLTDVANTMHVFSSDETNIAAVTLNPDDFGGLAFDNFRFEAAPLLGAVFECGVATAGVVERDGDLTMVALQADLPEGADADTLSFLWSADCENATIMNATSPDAMLVADAAASCPFECNVSLEVSDGVDTFTCTPAAVTLGGAGVEVEVLEYRVGARRQRNPQVWPMAGVLVEAYDRSRNSCAGNLANDGNGLSPGALEAVRAECDAVGSVMTNGDGVGWLDLPPGKYLLLANIDSDQDGQVDALLGRPTGRLECGRWKERHFNVMTDGEGNVVNHRLDGDD